MAADAPRPGAHWLARVAARAGHAAADQVAIDGGASMPDAWGAMASAIAVGEDALAQMVAKHYRLELATFEGRDARALRLVPEKLARQHHVLPLAEDDRALYLATANPNDFDAEQAIGFASGRVPVFRVAPPGAIAAAIEAAYNPGVDEPVSRAAPPRPAPPSAEPETTGQLELAAALLHEARQQRATELHLEPDEGRGFARFLIDGILYDAREMGIPDLNRLQQRLRVLAQMGTVDRQWPRRRFARIQSGGKTFDVRVSTTPLRAAERIVVRLLEPLARESVLELGWSNTTNAAMAQLVMQRSGVVLLAAPPGQGLTTMVATVTKSLVRAGRKPVCLSDSAEYEVAGARHVLVDSTTGGSIAEATEKALTLPEDVVVIAELGDARTATVALEAAGRGKLVVAGVRAAHAADAIARVSALAKDAPRLAPLLRGVMAQRLLRALCGGCAVAAAPPPTPDEQRLEQMVRHPAVKRAVGCDQCGTTGYRGRLAVAECLRPSPALAQGIAHDEDPRTLVRMARAEGFATLASEALDAVDRGRTTLAEAERALGTLWRDEAMFIAAGAPAAAAPVAPSKAAPAAPQSPPASAPVAPLEPPKAAPAVLVVDDDPVIRTVVRTALSDVFIVEEAATAREAAAHAMAAPFALIILDLHLPDGHGRTLLQQWRAAGPQRATPVIVLTGDDDATLEIELMDDGADDYQRKPIAVERFAARCRAAVRRARLR